MIAFLFTSCSGQERKANTTSNNIVKDTAKHFIIGNYMITPKLKKISTLTMVGGVDWDGYTYRKDPKINYDKTTLLVLGNNIFFKEYFPFNFDIDKLKIIYKDDFWLLYKDNHYIYCTSQSLKPTKIDISGYKPVNDFIYKSKNGTLFFLDMGALDIDPGKLNPIGIKIDESSIKHLAGNYYHDKNGLYFFGEHDKKNAKGYYGNYIGKSEKLVSAQNVIPVISKKYISFNNQVFAIEDNKIKELNIDAGKIIEVDFDSSGSFVTDGKNIYSASQYGYDDDKRNAQGNYGIWYPALYSGINLQKIYSPLLHFMKESNSVVINKNNPNDFPGLIAMINNEHYLLSDKKKTKIDKLLFYHPETKTTDIFDEKYLKIYTAERFIQYKNVLYFDGIPVETTQLDMQNLREIENSNYLTDGKAIFYIGNITGYGSPTKNGIDYAVFDDRILEKTFTKEMKVINPDLLFDGITIVNKEQKVKIKDLNLKIKIVE
nr:hypothetical protein [Flavobacterium sp. ASV13]